jgi:hypothetical protein
MGASPTAWPSGSIQYIPEASDGSARRASLHVRGMALRPEVIQEALSFFSANRSSRIIFSVKISYPFPKIHINFICLHYLKVRKDWIYTCCRSLSSIISSSRVTFSSKTFLISFWKKLIVIMKAI